MIDVPTTGTGPPEVWEPGLPRRRPSLLPALVALVLLVASSTVVVVALYRALEIRYAPRADACAGLDVGALATLAKSPPVVAKPGAGKQTCAFAVGRAALGTLTAEYTTSAFEVRILYAQEIAPQSDSGTRQELPGLGQGAWILSEGADSYGVCSYSAHVHDVNLVVRLRVRLLAAYCEPVALRSAVAASLRATLARMA